MPKYNSRKGPEYDRARELSALTGYNFQACYEWVTGKADPFSENSRVMREVNDLHLSALACTNDKPMSFDEIARRSGMTKQRVAQIYNKAIQKLKNHETIIKISKENE